MKTRPIKEIQTDIGQVTLKIEELKEQLRLLEFEWDVAYDQAFETQSEIDGERESYYAKKEGK